ncbi:hypothetical protein [Chitinophaga cymbidii]|uniref:Uncharacterized protein n=1 Tax=Chitinophaga cymbidii TaxID=1096750 RepID=A0A512RIR5_9BACT|nr:hypothetical protein [Chitinophaga cymbidii]GEP95570.1 hypothetical protein CCY01nite_18300 [Chitinophaga cymbidii]
MIILRRGEISTVAVTASETGHTSNNYTFKFIHSLTKRVVNVELPYQAHTKRVDYFQIDVDQFFSNEDEGEYTYELYANYDYDQPDYKLEEGIMRLIGERTVYIQYEPSIEYVTYGG